jgi:hypothetical protein
VNRTGRFCLARAAFATGASTVGSERSGRRNFTSRDGVEETVVEVSSSAAG